MLREMMLFHTAGIKDPGERVREAREFLKLFETPRPMPDVIDMATAAQAAELAGRTNSSLCHDELGLELKNLKTVETTDNNEFLFERPAGSGNPTDPRN